MGLLTRRGAVRNARVIAAAALVALAAARARAAPDLTVEVDLRAIAADATPSFLDGGLGKFRYGESGLALGRLRLALDQPVGETLLLHVDATSWGDEDRNPIDLTEAFAELRPYPRDGWRVRMRAGFFYTPASLENRAEGWESPYGISFSALNSWIAEEIRTIGIEGSLDRLGRASGGEHDLGMFVGVYGWNDPAGTLVARHGFALHDRQTLLFGRVGEPGSGPVENRQLFHEIDGRPGYYVGARWRWRDRVEAQAMHYDNRGDPTEAKPSIDEYAWLTRFDTVGVRAEALDRLTLIAQWLDGYTAIAPPPVGLLEWEFSAWYLLGNFHAGPHGVTLRYDDFLMHNVANAVTFRRQRDAGTAWTLAWTYERDASPWRLAVEATRAQSRSSSRPAIGLPPLALESRLEVSLRYRFRSRPGIE
jgi:hypothetical protein